MLVGLRRSLVRFGATSSSLGRGGEVARTIVGRLLAASVQRLPGLAEPPCRWLLAYRQEFHGEVAAWLQVSRTPVREALRRLETEGLLTFEAWRGVVVADLDRQQVGELYAMREVLEGAAARLAARHIDDCEIDCLEILLERAEAASADPEALAAINRQLHEAIHGAAHNRYLTQTLEQLRNALALLRGTTFALPGRAEAAAVEHRAIVTAIRERDPEAAEAAARAHIAAAQRARLRLLMEESDT